jgi:hypothetical protein
VRSLTVTLDAAIWGAEPTGPIMDGHNFTDKKFPGDEARGHAGGMASTAVTLYYRSREPLRPCRSSLP